MVLQECVPIGLTFFQFTVDIVFPRGRRPYVDDQVAGGARPGDRSLDSSQVRLQRATFPVVVRFCQKRFITSVSL